MTTKGFLKITSQLDRKVLVESRKILLFIDQCPAHARSTTSFSNIKVAFLQAAHNHQLIQVPLQKKAASKDCSHARLGIARKYCM
jgi:hypothetical protein